MKGILFVRSKNTWFNKTEVVSVDCYKYIIINFMLIKHILIFIFQYLEQYINYINMVFGNNVPTMNFAQAAVLVQNSANIYSKKVDFLWSIVLQLLESLRKKQYVYIFNLFESTFRTSLSIFFLINGFFSQLLILKHERKSYSCRMLNKCVQLKFNHALSRSKKLTL